MTTTQTIFMFPINLHKVGAGSPQFDQTVTFTLGPEIKGLETKRDDKYSKNKQTNMHSHINLGSHFFFIL